MRAYARVALILGLLLTPIHVPAMDLKTAVVESQGRLVIFTVEMATTAEARARGLMGRRQLAADAGMLFIFPSISRQTMWMKDTPLSLDMLFIAHDGRIVRIVERTMPFSTRLIASRQPIKAVLELNGGTLSHHGIRPGDRLLQPKLQISSQ
ncbi:MAG: DUF192 domain-containing protein [Rhodospirillaceae bacterium]